MSTPKIYIIVLRLVQPHKYCSPLVQLLVVVRKKLPVLRPLPPNLDYKARLTCTPCYFWGRCQWFICPLVVNDSVCNRRFGVFISAKISILDAGIAIILPTALRNSTLALVDALIKNPEMLLSYLKDGDFRGLLLALKAYSKMAGKIELFPPPPAPQGTRSTEHNRRRYGEGSFNGMESRLAFFS